MEGLELQGFCRKKGGTRLICPKLARALLRNKIDELVALAALEQSLLSSEQWSRLPTAFVLDESGEQARP